MQLDMLWKATNARDFEGDGGSETNRSRWTYQGICIGNEKARHISWIEEWRREFVTGTHKIG